MSKEYHRNRIIDRSSWAKGTWDDEPDFHEWTTKVGYPAYAYRLQSGSWCATIIAPHPIGNEFGKFYNALKYDFNNPSFGIVSKTDVENISEFNMSFEHWKSPGFDRYRTSWRGEYRTLVDLIETAEINATDLFNLNEIWGKEI